MPTDLTALEEELCEALERLIPRNLHLPAWLKDDSIIPVDFTVGALRQASAALTKAKDRTNG